MKEYKRLSNNNLDEYNPEYDFCMGCKYFGEPNGCNRPNGTCGNYERFIETYNRLAELEDKIENGTLIELPCKVGDTFWEVDTLFREVKEIKAQDICTIIRWQESKAFGRWLFNTKAEAEKRLEELKGK